MGEFHEKYLALFEGFPYEEARITVQTMCYWISIDEFRALVDKAIGFGFRMTPDMVLKIMLKTIDIIVETGQVSKYQITRVRQSSNRLRRYIEQHPDGF